jgi:hypothetical protein
MADRRKTLADVEGHDDRLADVERRVVAYRPSGNSPEDRRGHLDPGKNPFVDAGLKLFKLLSRVVDMSPPCIADTTSIERRIVARRYLRDPTNVTPVSAEQSFEATH